MGLLPTTVTKRNVSLSSLRWLLIGEPKIGKTAILSGFPDLLLLATEKRYNAFDFKVVNVVSWRKDATTKYGVDEYGVDEYGVQNVAFVDIVNEIYKGGHGFKTIAIDTIDVLTNLCVNYVCKYFKIKHVSDLGFAKSYDMVKSELNNELNKLFMTSCGLVFTSHVKSREVIKPSGGSFTKITSSLINQARDVVHPKVSTIGLMKVKTIKTAEGKYEEKRVITFKPTELEEVGHSEGVLPDEIVTLENPKETYHLIKSYYDKLHIAK